MMTKQSGMPGTIRESNQASDVRKAQCTKGSILLPGSGVIKISSVVC